jgi:hypothetical protein
LLVVQPQRRAKESTTAALIVDIENFERASVLIKSS